MGRVIDLENGTYSETDRHGTLIHLSGADQSSRNILDGIEMAERGGRERRNGDAIYDDLERMEEELPHIVRMTICNRVAEAARKTGDDEEADYWMEKADGGAPVGGFRPVVASRIGQLAREVANAEAVNDALSADHFRAKLKIITEALAQ